MKKILALSLMRLSTAAFAQGSVCANGADWSCESADNSLLVCIYNSEITVTGSDGQLVRYPALNAPLPKPRPGFGVEYLGDGISVHIGSTDAPTANGFPGQLTLAAQQLNDAPLYCQSN